MIEGIVGLVVALLTWLVRRAIKTSTAVATQQAASNAEDHQRVIDAITRLNRSVIRQDAEFRVFVREHKEAHRIINDRLNSL